MEGESPKEHLESAREHLEKARIHATQAGAEAKAAAIAKVDELRGAADGKVKQASAQPGQWQADLEDRIQRKPLQAIGWPSLPDCWSAPFSENESDGAMPT